MAPTNIHMPVALQKGSNLLVNAKDVPHGSNCNCYCFGCNGDLIAVNQEIKQKAHFRHKSDAECSFKTNLESYIHWLAKVVFSEIEYINLPPIYYSHLALSPIIHKNFFVELKSKLKTKGILREFDKLDQYFPRIILQKSERIKIDGYAIEQSFSTEYGEIRVDIVLNIGGNSLFVEPFFTHQIDANKKEKIRNINISTISINLLEFIKKAGNYFELDRFRTFLVESVYHKEWVYLREEKMKNLVNNVLKERFDINIQETVNIITQNRGVKQKVRQEIEKRNKLLIAITNAQEEIDRLHTTMKEVSLVDLFKPN